MKAKRIIVSNPSSPPTRFSTCPLSSEARESTSSKVRGTSPFEKALTSKKASLKGVDIQQKEREMIKNILENPHHHGSFRCFYTNSKFFEVCVKTLFSFDVIE